jgi:hypothetical protein
LLLLLVIALAISGSGRLAYAGDASDGVDQPAAKAALLKAYPGLFTISGNVLTWTDGTTMVWDDGKTRDAEALLESPDIEDMFRYVYPTAAQGALVPAEDFDPGRIRNEAFFEKLYGKSAAEVGKHIANVNWLPKLAKKPCRSPGFSASTTGWARSPMLWRRCPRSSAVTGSSPAAALSGGPSPAQTA